MPRTTTLKDLADRLIEGGLEDWLRQRRDDGESLDSIARRLEHDHDIAVTGMTVRSWCRDYGISTSRPTAEDAA